MSMLRPVAHLQAPVGQPPDRRAFFINPAKQLDDEAMKKSAAAAQQLGSAIGDPASIGAKLMRKMGFGVAGQGLGRAGQVRCLPRGHPMHVQNTACALLMLPMASLQAISHAALPSSRCAWQSKVVSFIKLSGTSGLRACC